MNKDSYFRKKGPLSNLRFPYRNAILEILAWRGHSIDIEYRNELSNVGLDRDSKRTLLSHQKRFREEETRATFDSYLRSDI